MWKRLLDSKDVSHYLSKTSHDVGELSHNHSHQGDRTMATTYKQIWDTLSKIDVTEHIEKKGNLSYLSWAWAWGTLMGHYPNAKYINAEKFYPDGSCEVRIDMDIDGCDRHMWLAVMDHVNKAILNPNARSISDSKMRCLVKCIAMFGLGHYIYAGEDVPDSNSGTVERNGIPIVSQRKKAKATPEEKLVKKPAEDKPFSFTPPDEMIMSDASAKQMGYLRVCLVRAGKEFSKSFEVIDAGGWPTKEDVSNEIQGLVDDGYGSSNSKEKPWTIITIPPPGPEDPDDDDLPF